MTAGHVRGTDQSASHQEHVRSKEERLESGLARQRDGIHGTRKTTISWEHSHVVDRCLSNGRRDGTGSR